jgi:PAS domain S-box-containing protein
MSKFTSKSISLKNFEKENTEIFKTIPKSTKNLIFTIDEKYRITSANTDAARFIGGTPNKIVGNSLFELAPEGLLKGQKKNVKDIFVSGHPLVVENWLIVSENLRYYQTRFEPVIDEKGAVSSILTIASDITENKQAEVFADAMETLASANAMDDMLQDVMKDLKYLIPYDKASIALVNDPEQQFEVYRIDSKKPGQTQRLDLHYSETVLHSVYLTGKKLSRGSPPAGKKPKEHDSILHKEYVKSQLFVPIKHKKRVIGTLNVCTRDKQPYSKDQEKTLIKFSDILAAPLNRILTNNELAGLKAETEFYNDLMAHDQNNINQGLIGYYEMLQMQPELSIKQKTYLSESLALIENSIILINNVRTLKKLRDTEPKIEKTDIFDCYTDAVDTLIHQFPNENIEIAHNLMPGKYLVMANAFLKDVFINILNNSVKFDRKTTHRIELKAKSRKLDGNSYIQVSITDYGPGIEDPIKERLFDRSRRQKSLATSGSGLGLSVVREIIDRYGGRIRVEDRVANDHSKGTKIIFCIPVI